jgi:aminoglycoside phosphotransferase (APT) family kinase protein
MDVNNAQIEAYLNHYVGQSVRLLAVETLGRPAGADNAERRSLKTYGYGQPILVRYRVDGIEQRAVLRTVAANPFGHERRADRAADLLLSYDTFNELPRHARALDIGVHHPDGRLVSLASAGEFFLLTDYCPGTLYADDLQRLRDTGELADYDLERAETLAHYLANIHTVKRDEPALYRRAIRDLVGSGEGVFGLTDNYPPDFALVDAAWLERVEHASVRWRWQLKRHPERLAQIHGDFHPFNVLFGTNTTFWLLDRSRGGWGEPADDVVAMAINYLFFSLQRTAMLQPPFTQLWDTFWNTYLERTGDTTVLELAAPFFAWRALVVASPTWYNVPDTVRLVLFHFIDNVLAAPAFDPARINTYLQPASDDRQGKERCHA